MDIETFNNIIKNGVINSPDAYEFVHQVSERALKISADINGSYHKPEELRALLSELIGSEVDESVRVFPPFSSDFGLNIKLGKNVFINAGVKMQDQGGITIGNGCLIGHNVVFATINHGEAPSEIGRAHV